MLNVRNVPGGVPGDCDTVVGETHTHLPSWTFKSTRMLLSFPGYKLETCDASGFFLQQRSMKCFSSTLDDTHGKCVW